MLDWDCRINPIEVAHPQAGKLVLAVGEAFVPHHKGLFTGLFEESGMETIFPQSKQSVSL